MKNPLDYFFAIGDKATKGDPVRKARFDYYLLWIIFLAFFSVMLGNGIEFYKTLKIANLGWMFVMIGILWFQYYGLKQARTGLKVMEEIQAVKVEKTDEVEDAKSMLGSFQ